MDNKTERTNAGYIITRSIQFPTFEYVLGEKPNGSGYVTWYCKNGIDYYYGHYISDRDVALLDLYERAQDEIVYVIDNLKSQIERKKEKPE